MANVSGGISFSGGFTFIPTTGSATNGPFIAFQDTNSTMAIYTWSGSGFGTKLSNPVGMPAWQGGISFNPDNSVVAYGAGSTPFIHAYALSNAGFGTKYSNPSVLPNSAVSSTRTARVVTFNNAGNVLAMIGNSGDQIFLYAWNNTTGFGTKFNTPAGYSVTNNNTGIAFHPNDTSFINTCDYSSARRFNAYAWNNSTGAGTRFEPDGSLPFATYGVAFSPSGNDVAVIGNTSPWIFAYQWSSVTGFGTKYTNPASLAGGVLAGGVAFSKSGGAVVAGGNTSARLVAYPWTSGSGFGTRFSNPVGFNPGFQYEVSFSPDGTAVAIAHDNSPYVSVFAWSDSTGFGTQFSNPATLPTEASRAVKFSN